MPSRTEETRRNLKDHNIRYSHGSYEKYCNRGFIIKHGWFNLERGCPKCRKQASGNYHESVLKLIFLGLIKLLLQLAIIFSFAGIFCAGYYAFTHQLTPIWGSISVISAIILFIVFIKISHSNRFSDLHPKFSVVFFSCIALVVIFAFSGLDPFAGYKDKAASWVSDQLNKIDSQVNASTSSSTTPISTGSIPSKSNTNPFVAIPTPKITAGKQLSNPTWQQLKDFLRMDKTDEIPYDYPTFVCEDFARTLKRNANSAGWRCAIVDLEMSGYTDPFNLGIAPDAGHACNAFETTDRGLVYIDCTGYAKGEIHPNSMDKIVDIKVGGRFVPVSIFPEPDWQDTWDDAGKVEGIDLEW